VPSLDLRFADDKSLTDAVTGQSLVTFTRASSGTYVGADGLIKTAVTNLALQSEDFSTTWGSSSYTITTNATTAPNGTASADKAVRDTTNAVTAINANVTVTVSTAYNFSCFVKAAEWSKIGLREGSSTGNYVTFDLSTGSIISSFVATGAITAYPNGWYRISMQMTTGGAQTTYGLRVIPLPPSYTSGTPSYSFTGDGTSGLFLWGAQLEQSSTVGEYIPTTSTINSAPRFDHNPTTGESLGLLVEEQRTNLRTYSEAILSANLYGTTNSTLTTVSIANPFGGTTASLFTLNVGANTGNNTDGFNFGSGVTLVNSTAHAQFLFVKPAGATVLRLRSNTGGSLFDFTLTGNGTAPSPSADLQSAAIVPFPNGWYRVSWIFTSTTSAPGNRGDYWTIKTNVADGTNGLYVVGAQLEAGAFPTSYIPTTTATVTRSADVASISGSNFSSWYRQDEGTVLVETRLQSTVARNAAGIDLNDNSTNNRLIFRAFTTGSFDQYIARSGGSTVATIASANIPSLLLRKSAIAYRVDDFALTAEGLAPNTDTSGAVPVGVNQAFIGSALSGTEFLGGHIRRLCYWNQRLPNSTLEAITR
jgi:hypothetical protein